MVPGDSDLEICREHIKRLQEVRRREEEEMGGGDEKVMVCVSEMKEKGCDTK